MKRYTGKRPHPQMQEEFMTEPAGTKGKSPANKLIAKRGLKEKV